METPLSIWTKKTHLQSLNEVNYLWVILYDKWGCWSWKSTTHTRYTERKRKSSSSWLERSQTGMVQGQDASIYTANRVPTRRASVSIRQKIQKYSLSYRQTTEQRLSSGCAPSEFILNTPTWKSCFLCSITGLQLAFCCSALSCKITINRLWKTKKHRQRMADDGQQRFVRTTL